MYFKNNIFREMATCLHVANDLIYNKRLTIVEKNCSSIKYDIVI